MNSLDFNGFGIGGDFGYDKKAMDSVLDASIPYLDELKPRHFLGIGYPEDMERIIKGGIDTFDCTVPTHYARRGIAFTSQGVINLKKRIYLTDKNKLDKNCICETCLLYKRNYIAHLIRAKEITALRLLKFHNIFYFNHIIH